MKYNILGFQQTKLIENKLNVEDAFILRVIKDMYSSASMEFIDIDGKKYMWVNYSYLMKQIPIIGTKRNLMRRIDKYSEKLLILRHLKHEKNGIKGNFSYITPTKKLDELQDFDLMTESHKGYDKIAQGLCQDRIRVMTKSHNKDTSIRDTSIKDNIYSIKNADGTILSLDEGDMFRLTEKYPKIDIEHYCFIINDYCKTNSKNYKSLSRVIYTWVNNDINRNGKYTKIDNYVKKEEEVIRFG